MFNRFTDKMKSEIWKVVLSKINIQRFMTDAVRKNFNQFCAAQGAMDFTKENVANLITMIFENKEMILEQAIVDVFDMFTRYHNENRCHIEGWKTNDKWKVNRKIILPNWVRFGEYMSASDIRQYGDKFKTNYSYHSEYSDIDKVMCYISGKNYDQCHTIYEALDYRFTQLGNVKGGSFDGTCESEFFNMRFFKKGTLHIEFKDKHLWQEFNMRACAGKQWLPEAEERKWKESKQPKQEPVPEARQIAVPEMEEVLEFDF
jgi:hypothetical protein